MTAGLNAQLENWVIEKCREIQQEPNTMFIIVGRQSDITDEQQDALADHFAKEHEVLLLECPVIRPNSIVLCCPDQNSCEALVQSNKETVH